MATASENVPARHGAHDEVTAAEAVDHVSDTNKPAPHAIGSTVGVTEGAMGSSVGIETGCPDGDIVGCERGCELGCING